MTQNPRHSEDEWFARHEQELIEDLRRERSRREGLLAKKMKEEEGRKLRDLHRLKCPKCGCEMKELETNRITSQCSVCAGIFIGRNELEDALLKKGEERKTIRARILRFLMHEEPSEDTQAQLKKVLSEREQTQKKVAELLQNGDARKQKELHWLKCPNCGSDLKQVELGAGIPADECLLCKGIYLDTGEMQEILLKDEPERLRMRRKLLTLHVEAKR